MRHTFREGITVSKSRFSTSANGHAATPTPGSGFAPASEEAVDFEANGQNEQTELPIAEMFRLLLRQFHELQEYVSYYLSAKADRARLGLRNALFSMTLAALAFVVVASLCVSAIWLVLAGTAEGLGIVFGNRPWAGNLVTGLLLMAALAGWLRGIVISLKKSAREGTVAKYENQQFRQQARYGHNVADRAAAHGSEQE